MKSPKILYTWIPDKSLYSRWRQVLLFMSESFSQPINSERGFIQKGNKRPFSRVRPWMIHLNDSFKNAYLGTTHATFLSKSLNHSTKRFVKKRWYILKLNKRLSLWLSHRIIQSADSFKTLIHFQRKQVNYWFVQKRLFCNKIVIQPIRSFGNEIQPTVCCTETPTASKNSQNKLIKKTKTKITIF